MSTQKADRVVVRAKGDMCGGAPRMVVYVDGKKAFARTVSSTKWSAYAANIAPVSGRPTVKVAFTNDRSTRYCDRNLRLDLVRLVSTGTSSTSPDSSTGTNPFAGTKLYVDPNSNAERQAAKWRSSRPQDAKQMDKIAAQPDADWLGDWSGNIRDAVDEQVTSACKAGTTPVLVAYNIPKRDCGSYSSGGARSAEAYRSWMRSFAGGIKGRKTIVILEPDAMALTGCLSATEKKTRSALIRNAVNERTR